MDPVYTGRFTADSNGEVKFGFENKQDGQHVKFSGITVRACEIIKPGKYIYFFYSARQALSYCMISLVPKNLLVVENSGLSPFVKP